MIKLLAALSATALLLGCTEKKTLVVGGPAGYVNAYPADEERALRDEASRTFSCDPLTLTIVPQSETSAEVSGCGCRGTFIEQWMEHGAVTSGASRTSMRGRPNTEPAWRPSGPYTCPPTPAH
ncbi:MAG: hypothetical protein HOO96_05260 [Polyangiaceae bacterium]|nr:hypothetical protein [Polyangiaceae bacterium]